MQLKLYDTLTREKRAFEPLDPNRVRMYVCGPTVYDFAHIGNARPVIVFDVLFRLLRHLAKENGWGDVSYVRNITDVDDKINTRAAERGISISELTRVTIKQFHDDIRALGVLMPEDVNVPGESPTFSEPRATDHIDDMKELIERLIESDHAYVEAEHVLFRVASMSDYGELSKRSLDEMIAGARVDVAPYKHDPMDFVLWKPSKSGEPAWESPHGITTRGRPGWHIECSAMAWRYLGRTFDIHGGGIDLVFPHHENEIAQSRCAFHMPMMANFWMHNGFLQVEGEKMAKSVGNFITIRELLESYPGDVIRLLMLMAHYRQPMDWTVNGLEMARKELLTWSELILDYFFEEEDLSTVEGKIDGELIQALCDDLNTPQALARLREMYQLTHHRKFAVEDFVVNLQFMGFKNLNKPGFFHPGFDARLFASGPQIDNRIAARIIAYRAAAANGMFSIADELRETLDQDGFRLQLNQAGVLFVGNKTSAEVHADQLARGSERSGMLRATEASDEFASQVTVQTEPLAASATPKLTNHEDVEVKIQRRNAARRTRNFAEADHIRDELARAGIILMDDKDGNTTWKLKQ